MMDIGGLSAASVVWPVSATARSATTDTATGSTANDGTALADRARQADNRPVEATAPATANTAHPIDPDLPTGPPPAFTTTPLELEGDWQVILARLSAASYAQVQAMAPDAGAVAKGSGAGTAAVVAPPAGIDASAPTGAPDAAAPKALAAATMPPPGPRAA